MREERRGGLNKRDCRISGVQPADSTAQCNAVGRLAQGMQHSPHSGITECGVVDAEDAQLSLCLLVRSVLATPHYSTIQYVQYVQCILVWHSGPYQYQCQHPRPVYIYTNAVSVSHLTVFSSFCMTAAFPLSKSLIFTVDSSAPSSSPDSLSCTSTSWDCSRSLSAVI
jgi:hypothetical protein